MYTPPIKIIAIAERPEDHARGLSGVANLPPMSGMLFLFWESRVLEFTMCDTPIPLDIIFADSNGIVVRVIERATALSPEPQSSMYPASVALEVPAGTCGDLGIARGARMLVSRDRSQAVFDVL